MISKTISTAEFNKKYNLNVSSNSFSIAKGNNKRVNQVSGKPTTNVIEIAKRFFTNKWAFAALIIFVAIVVTAIVVPLTSSYGPKERVSNTPLDINYLHPASLSGGVATIVSSTPPDVLAGQLDAQGFQHVLPGQVPTSDLWYRIDTSTTGIYKVHYSLYNYLHSGNAIHHLKDTLILGTDGKGRDIWTRVWIGTRDSLSLAVLVTIVESFFGIALGAYIGFHAGSKLDTILMRIVEVIASVPPLIWFILILFIIPGGFWSMFIALVIVGWLSPVASTRMFIMRVKDAEYIKSAEAIGVSKFKRIYNHALMNILGKLLVSFVRRIPAVIFAQATLAFLGLSADTDAASLGDIINDAKGHSDLWWYMLAPTLILLGITISLQLVANGLHDAFDPRTGRAK